MADGLGAALPEPLFDRLVIVGLGLIGSSLARVARRKNLARTIIAADKSPEVLERDLGLIPVPPRAALTRSIVAQVRRTQRPAGAGC